MTSSCGTPADATCDTGTSKLFHENKAIQQQNIMLPHAACKSCACCSSQPGMGLQHDVSLYILVGTTLQRPGNHTRVLRKIQFPGCETKTSSAALCWTQSKPLRHELQWHGYGEYQEALMRISLAQDCTRWNAGQVWSASPTTYVTFEIVWNFSCSHNTSHIYIHHHLQSHTRLG